MIFDQNHWRIQEPVEEEEEETQEAGKERDGGEMNTLNRFLDSFKKRTRKKRIK